MKRWKFKNIVKINFGGNKLGIDNIPTLFELNFRKLIELNLYLNNFSDCKIFN